MKYKSMLFGVAIIAIALAGISCKSAPQPQDEVPEVGAPADQAPTDQTPVQPDGDAAAPGGDAPAAPTDGASAPETGTSAQDTEPPDAEALAALEEAAAKMENARVQAMVFDGPTHDKENWEAAEVKYNAKDTTVEKTTRKGVDEGISFYNLLTRDYELVFQNALPLYARARDEELAKARAEAIEAGINEYSPERLAPADTQADEARRLYATQDYFASSDAANRALDMYEILTTVSQAHALQGEIDEHGFRTYDLENAELGDQVLAESLTAYDGNNIEASLVNAEEAYLRYNLVLNTGWKNYAMERGNAAGEERRAAMELKANVAVRDDFNYASDVYNQAQANFRSERYPDAADLYFQSEFLFAATCVIAQEKRQIAEDAIRQAEENAAASDERARNAEAILQGGEE